MFVIYEYSEMCDLLHCEMQPGTRSGESNEIIRNYKHFILLSLVKTEC